MNRVLITGAGALVALASLLPGQPRATEAIADPAATLRQSKA